HAQVAAVVRPQTAGMVRLPIPKLVDRGLAENGPVRLEPAPEQVGFGPRVEDLFGRSFDPAGDRDPEEGDGRARSGSRNRQSLFLFALRNASDRKSTRLNSSHGSISYAVFRLTKKICRPLH